MKNFKYSTRILVKSNNFKFNRVYLSDIINLVNNHRKVKSINK